MKKLNYSILLLFSLFLVAFVPFGKNVKLIVEAPDCPPTDSLFLYQFEGFGFSKVQMALNKGGKFEFKMPKSDARFYYLGNQPTQLKPIILGTESEVKVKGNCGDFGKALVSSKINKEYDALKKKLAQVKQETGLALQEFQKAQTDEGAQNIAIFKMGEVDDKRVKLLAANKDTNPLLSEITAVNTYLSFQNNSGNYYSEIDYFSNEFFQFADFKNPYYNYNPWVYESFKEFTKTLCSANLNADLLQSYLDDALAKVPTNTHAYQLALTGVVISLSENGNKKFNLYGKRLLQKYDKQYPTLLAPLKGKIMGAGAFLPGAVAPNFSQNQPNGKPLNLTDLRGKVVLVDFWASWCGPCRKENPNVKKLYEKYKDKGFDILGVSLDRTKSAWERAIEKDGLPWHHVSDLKGWKNEVAQIYSVSSIPHTILLDQEGKIIASKLRAVQLEQALAQIFGE